MPVPEAITAMGLQLGAQAASGTIAGAQGAIFGKGADRRQYQLHEKVVKRNEESAKELTNYNLQKQIELWNATNYGPQMEQLKKAGLNPGLIYGMSGGGGATANIAAGTPNTGGGGRGQLEIGGMGMNMAQLALLKAQKENIEADTANKQADIPVKQATVTKTQAETTSITQGVENQKAQQKLLELQKEIQGIELDFSKDSYQNRLTTINYIASKLNEEISLLEKENILSGKTLNTKVKLLTQELILKTTETWLKSEQAQNTSQDTKNKAQQLINMVQQNMRDWDKLSLDTQEQNMRWQQLTGQFRELPEELKLLLDRVMIVPGLKK